VPHLNYLVEGRLGVVLALFKAAAESGHEQHQKDLLLSLIDVFVKKNNSSPSAVRKELAKTLVYLNNTPKNTYKLKKSRNKTERTSPFSPLGCQILGTLFNFDPNLSFDVINSFTRMDKAILLALCKDINGSRFVEGFLDSPIKEKHKLSLFQNLVGNFGEIALDRYGSHCVEKLYKNINLDHKKVIAEELIKISEQLSNERHGGFVINCCKLDIFRLNEESWARAEEKEENKKIMFQEFLVKNEKGKKKYKKQIRK